ncbi:unnamed protein product [Rotaria sordida]|uniref:Uncharacterized protein n=1 Tax=Rotaria sordida TaxID=392033 RepID=A0A813X260_9BILA|nr:unnamed protein product [Rotaria sordida]
MFKGPSLDLSLMSWNILASCWINKESYPTLYELAADYQTRMNTIASQISSLNCNVTILQEAQENIIPSLKEKLGDNYLYQFAPNNPTSASVANGLLTLKKKDKITFFDIILNSNILDEIV